MRTALVALAAVAAAGCTSGRSAQAGPRPSSAEARQEPHGGMGAMSTRCPMSVPGTQVAVADTPDGESVTFTTSEDRADELRGRVRAMADMHNHHHQEGAMGGGRPDAMGSGSGAAPEHGTMPPPSRAAVADVDGGARLTVTPANPADLERLRSAVRQHAQHMQQTGTCGMHAGMGH